METLRNKAYLAIEKESRCDEYMYMENKFKEDILTLKYDLKHSICFMDALNHIIDFENKYQLSIIFQYCLGDENAPNSNIESKWENIAELKKNIFSSIDKEMDIVLNTLKMEDTDEYMKDLKKLKESITNMDNFESISIDLFNFHIVWKNAGSMVIPFCLGFDEEKHFNI